MNILKVFALIIVGKFIINLYRKFKITSLKNKYYNWIESIIGEKTIEEDYYNIKPETIALFNQANLNKISVSRLVPLGFGFANNTSPDVWDNMFVNDKEIILLNKQSFESAEAVFSMRIKQSINPFYWIESIVFLPKSIFTYFGVKTSNFIVKFLNLIWWAIMFIYGVYNEEVNSIIKSYLSKFFK